jgi:NAD-dependent deacetylase
MSRDMDTPSIVILTGAGISRESGLDTFRDRDGIWSQVRLEDVATPQAFARDPARVHAFYNIRRRQLCDGSIQPNAAHLALARLEAALPGRVTLVTQNVDDLHRRAGSTPVAMHGELLKARCMRCRAVRPWRGDLAVDTACPGCGAAGGMRPDVVWFGEMPMEMTRIQAALSRCTLFVSIGTSGTVYPAAGFVREAVEQAGAEAVELNLERSFGTDLFTRSHQGRATEIVPAFVDGLIETGGWLSA